MEIDLSTCEKGDILISSRGAKLEYISPTPWGSYTYLDHVVRYIHDENGQILAKTEDAARIKNYQDKEDRSKTTDFTMENKGAAYAGLNQKLSADLANAESEKDPPAAMCGLPGDEG